MPLPPRVVILSIAKDLAVALALTLARGRSLLRVASQACPVPCGRRRAGYFPLGESNQSRPRDGLRPAARGALRCSPGALSAFASCFAAKPGPRHPGACAQRIRCARRELVHPWARTGAPCSRARLRCSALANAGNGNSNGHGNGNSNSASMRWPWFLIFIPLRQQRDCAGRARSVSARGEAATAAERPQHDVAGRTIRPVQDARTEIALTRRRPGMAIGAPRTGTRTRAAGAVVGVGFLWFLFFADPKKGTRAAAAARNKGALPSPAQERSFTYNACQAGANPHPALRAPSPEGRGEKNRR